MERIAKVRSKIENAMSPKNSGVILPEWLRNNQSQNSQAGTEKILACQEHTKRQILQCNEVQLHVRNNLRATHMSQVAGQPYSIEFRQRVVDHLIVYRQVVADYPQDLFDAQLVNISMAVNEHLMICSNCPYVQQEVHGMSNICPAAEAVNRRPGNQQ